MNYLNFQIFNEALKQTCLKGNKWLSDQSLCNLMQWINRFKEGISLRVEDSQRRLQRPFMLAYDSMAGENKLFILTIYLSGWWTVMHTHLTLSLIISIYETWVTWVFPAGRPWMRRWEPLSGLGEPQKISPCKSSWNQPLPCSYCHLLTLTCISFSFF